MHNQNNYPSDKSLSNIFDPQTTPSSVSESDQSSDSFRSPTTTPMPNTASSTGTVLPSSPAPAYTALPYRDVEFHIAPILDGKVGDVELETVDGKRFLVHRKLLETETVFFHIYYGFVPVWRLNAAGSSSFSVPIHQGQYHQSQPQAHSQAQATRPISSATANSLNNLLCLPKILAGTLSRASPAPAPSHMHTQMAVPPPPPSSVPSYEEISPPPPPPKDAVVTAPTPTTSPYTWAVPETSHILAAFLSLIYPRGCITSHPDDLLTSLEITGRVVRAAMGYQSAKALTLARDRLGAWIESQPVETYAMASFFKFADLAKLASMRALAVPSEQWPEDAKVLMGRTATGRLLQLQRTRVEGLCTILSKEMEIDAHSEGCAFSAMTKDVWTRMTGELRERVGAGSELFELLEVDLSLAMGLGGAGSRKAACGECLVLLGKSIQRCLYEARDLPKSI
ncbi:hypothetical protein I317_04729 [Kwoniella heveanensis CBS 569]|nr:hypothetical protein I317_04729 [Kwoniella heveanensis CBS 569]